MAPPRIDLDTLMPHRRPMRLIDALFEVEGDSAASATLVRATWPLVSDGAVSPILVVELAAQTAAAFNGYNQLQIPGGRPGRKGFLVAVKTAEFHLSRIPVHSRIITRVTIRPLLENYRLITASASIEDDLIATATLQSMLV